MAYDKTKPADSDLISNSASDLRNNFSAIETGDSTLLYDRINLQEQASNPSAITGSTAAQKAFRLFAKNDSDSSQTEMFGIDDAGNVIQFSEDAKLGARDQSMVAQDLTIGSNSFVNNQNHFCSAYGSFDSSGTLLYGVRMTNATKSGTGSYTLKTTAVFQNANVVPVVFTKTATTSPTVAMLDGTITIASNVLSIPIQTENRSGSNVDAGFFVAIFGGF